MARQYFGVDRGGKVENVTTDTSTTSKAVEISIDLAIVLRDAEIDILIETLKRFRRQNPSTTLVT